jgi:hypothetical protein
MSWLGEYFRSGERLTAVTATGSAQLALVNDADLATDLIHRFPDMQFADKLHV